MQIHAHVIDSMILPNLVSLEGRLTAAAFRLMKLLPAQKMLQEAIESELLGNGDVVIESSSGTIGLGLALLCNRLGYPLIIVSDPVMDTKLRRQIEELGARVDIVQPRDAPGGIQQARLDRLEEIRNQYPNHFWTRQYDNPNNPAAYEAVAELLHKSIGKIDCLVGTVGSGGSMCGTTEYLRKFNPDLIAVAVDTHGSVTFGHQDSKHRLLRGLGSSLVHPNVDHEVIDEIHWVSAAEGFAATRQLQRRHAMFMGPTSGAAYLVASWWASMNPAATTVAIFPDEGCRYQETVYNDNWLIEQGLVLQTLPRQPILIDHPLEAPRTWCRMSWDRRSYQQVTGHEIDTSVHV